jgi:putative peptidoglycan lipid II flippase
MGNDGRRRLAAAAAFLMAATAASRVLGLFREIAMVYYLGLGPGMGAFTVAFKVPSLVRTLVADTALSAAFIPVFSELLQKERRREAWQLAATVSLLATVGLGAISLLGMLFAEQIIALVAPGYRDPATIRLAVELTRIMFPTVVVLGLAGILMGVLNSYERFGLPALAPISWNLVIIGSVAFFAREHGFYALAWGVLAGTVVELLIQLPAVLRLGGRLAASLDLRHPGVRQVGLLLGPVVLSLGIVNFNALINTIIASYISEPAPAYIDKAFRLFQLPQGMFAVAIGTVLFPMLSRLAAAGRMVEFRESVSLGIRQIVFVTLPFTGFFLVLGEPTSRLIYGLSERVQPSDIEQVAWALAFFSLGLVFVSANTMLNRAFYGIQKAWLPLVVGVFNLVLNATLALLLYRPLGVGGITLATSLVSSFNFFALLALLRREVGDLQGRRLLVSGMRSLAALVPLVVSSFAVWRLLEGLLDVPATGAGWRAAPPLLLSLSVAYLVGDGAYLVAAWLLRMDELRQVLDVVRRRRDPREAGDEILRAPPDPS